jgi:hypothetical protein
LLAVPILPDVEPESWPAWRARQPRRTRLSSVISLGAGDGYELRQRLERVARAEGRDATSLARLVIREAVEQREAALGIRGGPH